MKRKLLVILITVFLALFMTGCYVCIDFVCPPYQETVHPQILGTIYFCELLQYAREWAPYAEYRWMKSEWYELCSKSDIEWVLNKVQTEYGLYYDYSTIINLVHNTQPGYEKVPFGYVKYWDGTYRNVAVVMENGKIKAFIVVSGKLIEPVGAVGGLMELIEDYNITDIVI